ncbi:MAG TPA: LacI family DNA-binding transcriptional regulator [Longilinea sp.]|nr:LacI family DNA-binding transcriptional regulator [Longilinea sp.]
MQQRKHSVTISDVAKAAGVSVSTVSRVLNGKDDVAKETELHIQEVIQKLEYTSSLAARSMRSEKTNMIGLIMPDIAGAYAREIMLGVNRAIAESDHDLLLFTTGDVRKHETASREQQYVSMLGNSITDGVIIVAPVTEVFSVETPIVSIDPVMGHPGYPAIHATNYQGALDAMNYLIGLGHRRIGFIAGRPELESAVRRLRGYQDALKQANIELDESLIVTGDFTTGTAEECARQLMDLQEPPTAIFAANDQSAIGVYHAALERGLRIPEDMSLIGFDNLPEAAYLNLTTIDQFLSEMGYQATKTLFQLIEGKPLEKQIQQMPTHLVVRNSCREIKAG